MFKKIMTFVAAPLAMAGFGLLMLMESKRPLRKASGNKLQRVKTNVGLATVTSAAINFLFIPVIAAVARYTQRKKIGLLNLLPLPRPVKVALALVLLDYTFYWWHRWLHQSCTLWRFHLVHHTDLDLDVTTAARFHFGEWILSTAYRAGQVVVIGAGPIEAAVFETIEMLAAEFHHSNIELPIEAERRLNLLIVTPRMHGIHHSIIKRETDSNLATLFTLWDRLHGTLRLNVPQREITIGLPHYRDERELTFSKLIALPFREEEESWFLPDWERKALIGKRTEMAD